MSHQHVHREGSCFRRFALPVAWLAFGIAPPLATAQSDSLIIARTGALSPDNDGTFDTFATDGGSIAFPNPVVLNDAGQVAFFASLQDSSGGFLNDASIVRADGAGLVLIAREAHPAPDFDGTLQRFRFLTLNPSGQVVFYGDLLNASDNKDPGALYIGSGGPLTQMARGGQSGPNGTEWYIALDAPALSNTGQVAFHAFLAVNPIHNPVFPIISRSASGSLTDIVIVDQPAPVSGTFKLLSRPRINASDQVAFDAFLMETGLPNFTGIFMDDADGLRRLVRSGNSAPDGNGVYADFVAWELNNAGQVAFRSNLDLTVGGTTDSAGIFLSDGTTDTQLARAGQIAPDGNGKLTIGFGAQVALNDAGQVAFTNTLDDTANGSFDNAGVFRADSATLTQIARRGQTAPDLPDTYATFQQPMIAPGGQVAFHATLMSPGGTIDSAGLYVSDGVETLEVARTGQPLAGSTLSQILFTNLSSERTGLNSHGQIAYRAILADADEAIVLWTPELHWRSALGGQWDTAAHWTLSVDPAHPHDVFIDAAPAFTVVGPTDPTTIQSLVVGVGTGSATLQLQSRGPITAAAGVAMLPAGAITGDGTLIGNALIAGHLSPGTSAGTSAGAIAVNGAAGFAATATTFIQIAGETPEAFDHIIVTGDLIVDGTLSITLIDGFLLQPNQRFTFVDVGGTRTGGFTGLGEMDLVATLNGTDLFITYGAGDGNDIALVTIPEPAAPLLLQLISLAILPSRRQRR